MYRGYQGMGYYGLGQAPGQVVSSTTTLAGGTGGAPPGPETWGTDPVAIALQQIGGSVVQQPYGQEEPFLQFAIQAIYQAGQIYPGNPDASMNACWTCAYVYAYYATQQLIASGATLSPGGQITGGSILGPQRPSGFAQLLGQGSTEGVNAMIHRIYDSLRADTYAMAYYGGCIVNKAKGLNCAGQRPIVTQAVIGNQPTYHGKPVVVPPPAGAAAAPAASSNTGLILGGLAIAGAAAYLAFA
jgi:hypothetical protein